VNGDATVSLTASLERRDAQVSLLAIQVKRLGVIMDLPIDRYSWSLRKLNWLNDD
jgi:hypothetical protein